MFDMKGLIVVDLSGSKIPSDDAQMLAIDAGADDVVESGEILEIYTEYRQLVAIRNTLVAAGLTVTTAEKVMRPKTIVQADAAEALKTLKLIDRLEDLDDVQKVYSNLDITDELAEQFAGE